MPEVPLGTHGHLHSKRAVHVSNVAPHAEGSKRFLCGARHGWRMFFRSAGFGGAPRASTELAHDRCAVAARVVDPLALASIFGRHPVHLGARRILDGAGLDDDAIAGSVRRDYAITDFTTVHSPSAEENPSRVGWGLARFVSNIIRRDDREAVSLGHRRRQSTIDTSSCKPPDGSRTRSTRAFVAASALPVAATRERSARFA